MAHRGRASACCLASSGRHRRRRLGQQRGTVILARHVPCIQGYQSLGLDGHAARHRLIRQRHELLPYSRRNARLQQHDFLAVDRATLRPRSVRCLCECDSRGQDRRTILAHLLASTGGHGILHLGRGNDILGTKIRGDDAYASRHLQRLCHCSSLDLEHHSSTTCQASSSPRSHQRCVECCIDLCKLHVLRRTSIHCRLLRELRNSVFGDTNGSTAASDAGPAEQEA